MSVVRQVISLGFVWETADPFLFCVHHRDAYPRGNDSLGPAADLTGRDIGQDFDPENAWRMYHGDVVPGFPAHPHRGFETVTVVLEGFVDHSDSAGGAGRYGGGDVQWMTAGSGLQHAEMFPLLKKDADNPMELFQIWLNLPAAKKLAKPWYKMLWAEKIPVVKQAGVSLRLIAGSFAGTSAPAPAPDSWAADPAHAVAIQIAELAPGAEWKVEAAGAGVNRRLYFYEGGTADVGGSKLEAGQGAVLDPEEGFTVKNGAKKGYLLLLQGRPIGEPVAQYGPFVMNSKAEISQAMDDYRKTQFGGWPWGRHDYVQPREQGRFARYADGSDEKP